ncbi:MAG: glycoside hydrolase family 2, partial [Clostridiales bacterium]|nr:glycoside hydrolase family 2 [Clostridiales bacterium]
MKTISLNGEYLLRFADEQKNPSGLDGMQSIPAMVPGNVEIDLMNAGILPDIFFGNNVKLLRPYEFYRWRYEKTFTAPKLQEGQRIFIHFAGVDCIATYELNGEVFATSDNALIEHRFDVTDLLLEGENQLAVNISSPILHAAKFEYDSYSKSIVGGYESLRVRKAPSAYGWDIMPRTVSAGLWRDVTLEIEEPTEIKDLSFSTMNLRNNIAYIACSYRIHTDVHNYAGLSLRITGKISDDIQFIHEEPIRFVSGRADFNIENPKLWWPLGYGEPNVYEVTAEVLCEGKSIAEYKTSMGVRTVKLDYTDITDARGGEFRFIINGEPIFCKGSNWVPADAMHSRDASRYEGILGMWVDTGSNILRCWGGNVYEDHGFYDYCDRNGIMVWQDFTMACGQFPIDKEFMAVMRHEAELVVSKLRNHPSIILWNGDNECDEFILGVNLNPSINRLTREVLPQVINRLDPYRPYLASSPYISPEAYKLGGGDRSKMLPLMPEQHLWGPRDYYKSTFYTQATSHFTSETGYHGCNNLSSMKNFISEEKLWPWQNNDEWLTHASEMYGQDGPYSYRIKLMADQIHEMFGFHPDNLEDFILASQISQAEAKKFFIEITRCKKWRRTGVIWWNMMDGWPQFSDAVVSYDFIKKLAYHYIKRSQQSICLMMSEPESWHIKLMAGNDTLRSREGTYRVWDGDTDETLSEGKFVANANA